MKNFVSIEGRVLARALMDLLPVIERRNTYPIIGMVVMAVRGADLTLSATDLDLEVDVALDVIDAGGEWSVAVSPAVLHSIAKLAGPAVLLVERSKAGITVTVDRDTSYELDGLDADGFPRIEGEKGSLLEAFGNGQLAVLLDKVRWAVSTEETRYYLNGVAWQWIGGVRRFVATDGHRLAMVRYGEASETAVRIIPNKAVSFLRGMGPDVAIHELLKGNAVDPAKLVVTAPGVTVRMRLCDPHPTAGYPDVDRVIPKPANYAASFQMGQVELVDGIRRAMVMDIGRRGYGRTLEISSHDGRVSIGGRHVDYGTSRTALRAAWPKGLKPFGVNGRYLLDIVKRCAGDVVIHQVDPSAPITVADDDEQMTRIVMPMRV